MVTIMAKKIISLILLLISVALSLKHSWDSLHVQDNTEALKMMTELGINEALIPIMGGLMIVIAGLLLFPKTFFMGNLLNAFSILLIMILAVNVGNVKMALVEIPFLALPLFMMWLKHPLNN